MAIADLIALSLSWRWIAIIFSLVLLVPGCKDRPRGEVQMASRQARHLHLVSVEEAPAGVLEALRGPIREQFQCAVEVESGAIPIPAGSYDSARRQYRAERFLEAVKEWGARADGKLLGVTDVDLFVPDLNFVFGQAEIGGTAAVMSIHRLRPEFYGGGADESALLARAATEAVHELGHTFGLPHCSSPTCVMFFSNSILDTDRKGHRLCQQCRARAKQVS